VFLILYGKGKERGVDDNKIGKDDRKIGTLLLKLYE